jgi:hypothetical protein
MNRRQEQYHAYLLRLWLVKWNEKWVWRVSLENVHTGERHTFASMEPFVAFLREVEQTGQQATRTDHSDR